MAQFHWQNICSTHRNRAGDFMLATLEPARAVAPDLDSVDLVLRLIELLAASREPRGVSDIARELGISKPRAHRHLRALVQRGYARQDLGNERYEVGIKLLVVGEAVRDRFDVVGAIRPSMAPLRETSGLAVTASALTEDIVVVLDMLQGKSVIEFGIRPGARLDLHASAHGLVALAFGPPTLLEHVLAGPLRAWTPHTINDPHAVRAEVEQVRGQGWATAIDAVQIGVNALAAPVFDHRGHLRGAIALVGSSHLIERAPPERLIALVTDAAAESSRRLGWKIS
jgi:DNA-binding IclR family transcriptional regulator